MGWCETRASWKISNIKSWEVLRILFYALARLCCHDQSGKFFGDSCGFFWGDEISGCIRLIFLFELVQWHGSVVIWVDGVESWNSMIYAHMKARVVGFQIPEFRESRICSSTPVLPRFLWSFTGSKCSKRLWSSSSSSTSSSTTLSKLSITTFWWSEVLPPLLHSYAPGDLDHDDSFFRPRGTHVWVFFSTTWCFRMLII